MMVTILHPQSRHTHSPVQIKKKQRAWKKIKAIGELPTSSYFVFLCIQNPPRSTYVLLEKARVSWI